MAGEFLLALSLRQIAADAGGKRGAFDQSGDMLVGQPVGAGLLAARGDPPKQRPMSDAGELEPNLNRSDRAGEVARTAADLDLAPAGLAADPDEDALVEDFDPSGAFFGPVRTAVEADDFGAAQTAGEAEQQDGAVAQASRSRVSIMHSRSSASTASF